MVAQVLGHTDTKTTKKYARYGTRALKPFLRRRTIAKLKIVTKAKIGLPKLLKSLGG